MRWECDRRRIKGECVPGIIAKFTKLLDEVNHLHHLGENQHLINDDGSCGIGSGK